jgi:hypothetical protein
LISAAVALVGMLEVMFSFEGQVILELPLDTVRIAIHTGRKRRDKEKVVVVLSLTKTGNIKL